MEIPYLTLLCRPQDEDEIIELIKWAGQNNVALTSRSKAKVHAIAAKKLTVTSAPGITWEKLDAELKSMYHVTAYRLVL